MENNVDESCLETSLPTDVSLSQDDYSEMEDVLKSNENFLKVKNSSVFRSSDFSRKYESGDDCRLFNEHRMKNELLKMSVQMKEKSIKMDAFKAEHLQKMEGLECKVSETLRENSLLKTQIRMEREETKGMKEELAKKLNNIESNQAHLRIASTEIQRVLQAPSLSKEQYNKLLTTQTSQLSLTDFISKHLYERQEGYEKEADEARCKLRLKQDHLHQLQLNNHQLMDDLEKERQHRVETEVKAERNTKALEHLQKKIVTDDFKVNNFDVINKEKNDVEMKYTDVCKHKDQLEKQVTSLSKQLSESLNELTSLRQSVSLLTKDKNYLSELNHELTSKVSYLEGRCHYLNVQNDKYKCAREDLYEKYIKTREEYKRDYDEKLAEELERMGKDMQQDMQALKQANKEVSQREMRSLRESRDMAMEEKRLAMMDEKTTQKKYQELLLDFRQKQMWSGGQMGDLQNDLKVKEFEYQKLQVVLQETLKTLKDSQSSYDKLQKKMDVLMKEYYSMQVTFEKRNTQLESLLNFKESTPQPSSSEAVADVRQEMFLVQNKMISLERERNTLLEEKKNMSSDLQTLLNQNQELVQLKKMLETNNKTTRITFKKPIS